MRRLLARERESDGGQARAWGDPELIQSEHNASCLVCRARMRFLFQFGEPNEQQMLLGDAGIAYIYGCDAHPRECIGFVDCF